MELPHAAEAYVPAGKVTGYLLALDHPSGAPKARFFRACGYTEANAAELEAGLLRIARETLVVGTRTPHGVKYVADGDLLTPARGAVRVRTVWIVEPGDPRPRLITAYPA